MMILSLYQTPLNVSSIGAVCNSLGKTFLPEGNAVLPITPKAVCAIGKELNGLNKHEVMGF